MAVKKAVKKTVKKAAPKKGDEPVRAGRAPSGVKGQKAKVDKYKQGLNMSSVRPGDSIRRTQYDYLGEDSDGGVYETRSNTGFGRTKSYYKNSYGTSAKKMPTYNFPITYEAVRSKAKKKK